MVPTTGELELTNETKIFSTSEDANYFQSVINTQPAAQWRPAMQGVRVDANAPDQQPHNLPWGIYGTSNWVCRTDYAGHANVAVQVNFDVTAVREQFDTARDANVDPIVQAQVLNQQRTDTLDELRYSLNSLFEYSNDQLVYRNALEVPEERTNLIPTAKAPGVF